MAAKLFRRCVSCHCVADRGAFWRVVRVHHPANSQDIAAVPALPTNLKLPLAQVQLDQGMGRSAYLCRKASCLQQAQKKNRLGKALRVPIPSAIFTELERRLGEIPLHPESMHPAPKMPKT
ncbi:MAG: YlxR family protein [Pseudanabaena sp. ELA607]